MTVTIKFPPDIEVPLLAQARAEGIDVPRYVENLVRNQVLAQSNTDASRPAHELSPEQRLQNFQTWVKEHADNSVVLPDDAMERESIYGDNR